MNRLLKSKGSDFRPIVNIELAQLRVQSAPEVSRRETNDLSIYLTCFCNGFPPYFYLNESSSFNILIT